MASREKKPLAPSKAKQKANNDSGLPSNEIKSRKGKSLSNLKQQQIARDLIEAVATGSQLPAKLEASLPRKKVLRNLKHKQKLRVTKASLIKSKVTRKVTSRNLCRITSDIKKSVRAKRAKLSEGNNSVKASGEVGSRTVENHVNEAEVESIGSLDGGNRSAKNNLRTKKTKFVPKSSEVESDSIPDRDTDSLAGSSTKSSPKLSRKGRSLESLDTLPRGVKSSKFSGFKRNSIKDSCVKSEVDIKYTKGRKSARDLDCGNIRVAKSLLDTKSSIDLTIDEVIASMLSDSEIDSQQGITEKIEGKVTRSKKMFVEESNAVPDIEIKKEPDSETDVKITSDGENLETESVQSAIQLRKRSNASIGQRSLRNGKLRQSEHPGVITTVDLDLKKRRRLNSDDPVSSEVSTDNVADSNVDTESCFSESSCNDPQAITVHPGKDEFPTKQDTLKERSFEDSSPTGLEIENNNNGDRADRTSEIGPTLRSKTKAKSTEVVEVKNENAKVEYARIGVAKNAEVQNEEQLKKSNMDQARKDNILAKLSDKSKSRRSSLNIDMKKTVNSYYGTEKSDGSPKSQIDQMIENIKLTIAKSIESKIFGPEKGLGLSKNFEVPKIEEIIAPLSAESQKLGLEENTDEEKSAAISRNEIKSSDNTENSVAELKPKVADTAKEIEKLVMGDIELAETHSQNVQESEAAADTDTSSSDVHVIEINDNTCKAKDQQEESGEVSDSIEELKKDQVDADDQTKASDDDKKAGLARKSSRTTDKGSPHPENDDAAKKLGKVSNKVAQKSDSGEILSEDSCRSEETVSIVESPKDESTRSKAVVSESSLASKEVQKEAAEEKTKTTEETAKNEGKNSSSVAAESDGDAETLESITKEVERLVAEEQLGELETSANEAQSRPESRNKTEVPSLPGKLETADTEKQEVANVAKVDEPETNTGAQSEVEVTENAKEVEKPEETAAETVSQDSNCESSCTSKSKCSTSPVPSDASNVVEDAKKDTNESEKDDKREASNDTEDNNNANNGSGEEKDVYNNTESNDTTTGVKEEMERLNSVVEEQKSAASDDNKKRVLRTRDKTKKLERGQSSSNKEGGSTQKIKSEEEVSQKSQEEDAQDLEEKIQKVMTEDTDDTQNSTETETTNELERQARTRRSREAKKRKEEQLNALKNKRPKREIRRYDQQQNKEETLLDNEVAKINENNRSFLNKYGNDAECATNFRGFSEGVRGSLEKCQDTADNVRSKSENDLVIAKEPSKKTCENRLSRNLSENHVTKQTENMDILDADCKPIKTPETSQKDSDETSTSGESSSSVNITPKILETPEDKAKKESILGILGLEPLEKAAERLNHQKAKKEQSTGTLRTVIRVQKEKEKDKRRSRSPLKMVLKQGRGDGEGDSPENFYTIQKEVRIHMHCILRINRN